MLTATLTRVHHSSSAFETEMAMAQPVRSWLCSQPCVSAVVDEINAGYGIADLVAGEGTNGELERRTNLAGAITNVHQLRLLLLATSDTSEMQLREWAPVSWPSLRAQAIEPLIGAGLLEKRSVGMDTVYRATVDLFDPFKGLVAVELKLRDWTRGVAQATRYRIFAERAYLALPFGQIRDAAVAEARRNGIGLLAVNAESVDVVEEAPRHVPFQATRRRRASELMIQAMANDQHPRAGSPRGRLA
jgi:hypothetical protein